MSEFPTEIEIQKVFDDIRHGMESHFNSAGSVNPACQCILCTDFVWIGNSKTLTGFIAKKITENPALKADDEVVMAVAEIMRHAMALGFRLGRR